MKKTSIYSAQSQSLRELFAAASQPEKVLCGALDYAKRTHTALFCDGRGDILRKPFAVHNNPQGVSYLLEALQRSCRYHAINPKHVFFGGEDVGPFASNFVHALREHGFLVAGVNAADAKRQRDNLQASSDKLDLLGIAKVLLKRQGNFDPACSGVYRNLRELTRHRRRLVQTTTMVTNRVHGYVDTLFPGFLDERQSGVSPFSEASLWLMEERFSAPQIKARKAGTLMGGLARRGTPKPQDAVTQLQHHAGEVLTAPRDEVTTRQLSLAQEISHYRCLQANIGQCEREIAQWLAKTPAALLTSVRGIGITLAAAVAAELGDPAGQPSLAHLCSYAGIVPRSKQTGGPAAPALIGKVARRCNRILKDYLVQSANHLGLHGPEEFMADFRRREAAGQHAAFGIARRYLRMARCLMKHQCAYLPCELRGGDLEKSQGAAYYLQLWPGLAQKWRRVGALEAASEPPRPLGQWRAAVEAIYEIKLPL